MLEVDKTRAINPPPEKTKQYIVLLASSLTKNLRHKNAKRSRERISPDAKRSTGVIVPPPMQQEKHAGRDPPHAAREKRAGSVPRLAQQEGRTQAALVWFLRLFWDEPSLTRDTLALPRNRTPSVSA